MTIQEYIIDAARKAAEEFFRYASKVPEDKLDWKPLEEGQSVMSLAREIGITPTWAYDTLFPSGEAFDEARMAAQKAEMASWTTVAACEAEYARRFERFAEAVRQLPEEKFFETKWLPYEGGRDFTVLEMLDYPRWNATYHTGQVAYIQTLYGDREMY